MSKVEGNKNALRVTCHCLKQAVDVTITRLTWRGASSALGYKDLTEALGRISCPALTHLSCRCMRLLTSLSGCPPGLQSLDCSSTQVTSLAGCPPGLQDLDCSCTKMDSLAGCPPSLRSLNCNDNDVGTLEALAVCAELEELECDNSTVTSLAALAGCPKLNLLTMCGTRVDDLTPLAGHEELSWYVRHAAVWC